MLEDSLFVRAASDHVDYAKIDFRYLDVSSLVVRNLAETIRHFAVEDDGNNWPLLVESATVSLVVALIRTMSPDASTVMANLKCALGEDRKRRVMEYIGDNLHRQIKLDELAGVAALSPYHFVRSFKKSVGMTPLQYLAKRRVDAAMKMIRSTSFSLSHVAYACGFCSQSHMTTVFRAVAGTTPASYRREAL